MVSLRTLQALTNELLEEIFLRLGSPVDLARASTACVAFRRLIADPSFLRRYRSLHPPLLLGLIDAKGRGFQPAEAPPPSAALGRALARVADFSFEDYLPRVTGFRWLVREVRDGRVLIECIPEEGDDDEEEIFSRTWACVTPWPGDTYCCLPYPTTFSPPSKFISNSSKIFVPSSSLPDSKALRLECSSEWISQKGW